MRLFISKKAIVKLKEANASDIMLQVATENSSVLNLYKSYGFIEILTLDYYESKHDLTG